MLITKAQLITWVQLPVILNIIPLVRKGENEIYPISQAQIDFGIQHVQAALKQHPDK